uniref:Protein Rcp n=1 Tax=Vibrio cholerae serotype O1 (strain ATCC 39315 / El Tor Inaba N16961) TaxID=243277 RepID=RCP_VIBCH|nr:RecName: Full=Protein Rcp; AltName: Full=Protein SulA [Vibrio cholerae O1 biovar El Tor str. N16961]CAA39495.1 rcp [Vibrio cholerae]CAA43656.1 SulA protein [Vibrio cholerae O1 biovar El Tor]
MPAYNPSARFDKAPFHSSLFQYCVIPKRLGVSGRRQVRNHMSIDNYVIGDQVELHEATSSKVKKVSSNHRTRFTQGVTMRILITGGTGFVGFQLIKLLSSHELLVLTRDLTKAAQRFAHIPSQNLQLLSPLDELSDFNGIDAIINLRPDNRLPINAEEKPKAGIARSRLDITEQLVEKIRASAHPPAVFLSGSAWFLCDQQAACL